MSLINRIELSNFLDKSGGSEWKPTYRHNVLDLKGQNTAIVLMNGSGKTTITTAILGLLSRQHSLVSNMRKVFAPDSFGVYTHVRVEFIQPDMRTSVPTLPTISHTVTGEKYVFGVCGFRDGTQNLKYYCYPGILEDVPVANIADDSIKLLFNEEFTKTIREKNGSRQGISRDEWLDKVHDHWGAQQLNQMVAFLQDGGGDKSASLYKTKLSKGEKYHESFFYTHIAPQLTIGEATSETEKGEIFLDDTILSSSMSIVMAQMEGEKKEKRLQRQKKVSSIFGDIKQRKEEIVEAENNYKKAYQKVTEVAATVKHLVEDAPLPGLPVFAGQDNEVLNSLIKNIVIVPDADEPFLLKDAGLVVLLGKEIRAINQSFLKKSIKHTTSSQDIDIMCDLRIPDDQRGQKPKYYTLRNVLNFIDSVEDDSLKEGGVQADKKILKDLLQSAFNIFQSRCDTSPLRKKANLALTEVRIADDAIKTLNVEQKRLEDEKVAIEERLQTFKVDKIAFENMRDSGLFSEDELTDPKRTKENLKTLAEVSEQDKKNAAETMRPLHARYALYQTFSKEYPREAPDAHLQVIEAEEKRLAELLQATKTHRDNAQNELTRIEKEFNNLDAQLRVASNLYEDIQKVRPGYLTCKESFPAEEIDGFEKRIIEKKGYFIQQISTRKPDLRQAEKGYSFEVNFYELEGEVDPSEWLTRIDEERDHLIPKVGSVKGEIAQFEAELDLLNENEVAPGLNASKALRLIPRDIRHEPLHSFIKNHTDDPDQAEVYLSLFSSFLFAPVIQSENDISKVLNIFTEKEEDILLPVFHEKSLKGFLQNNDSDIKKTADDVFYLIAGKKTDLVECILDPEKREKRKIYVETQLTKKRVERDQIEGKLKEISSNSKVVFLAQKAKNSKDSQFGIKIKRLTREIEELEREQKLHLERFTEPVMQSVKAAEKFVLLGGPDKFTELYNIQVLLQKNHDNLIKERTDLKDRCASLSKKAEKYSEDRTNYKEKKNLKKIHLQELRDFLPDGLVTFRSAEDIIVDCEEKLQKTRNKQDFELNRAATYVETLTINSESDLQEQFNTIEVKRRTISVAIGAQLKKLEKTKDEVKQYLKYSEEYDRFLSSIAALYKRALHHIRSITEKDSGNLDSIVGIADELQSSLHSEHIDFACVINKSQEILAFLEKDNFEVLNNKASSAHNRISECERDFHKRCDNEINASGMDTILTLEEKNLFKEIKKSPEKIFHWANLFAETLNKEIEDFNKAKEHEIKLRATLAGSLTSLTDKAIGNYRTLQRVLKEAEGSASYSIKTEIASRENIESAIDEMIEMVKSAHKRYISDRENHFRDSSKSEDEEYQKNIKERISDKCYRSIFLKPVIKYRHPDIRGGNVTDFNISEKFKGISEGEKTSLALLMQVVIARYAQRRKMAEEFGQGIRRRRDAAESPNVLIIDGLFSSLSKPSLIKQAFNSIRNTQGAFQIIGLIHNPTYVGTHDFNVFPNLFIGRTYMDGSDSNENEGWVVFDHRQKEMMGQMGFADFRAENKQPGTSDV